MEKISRLQRINSLTLTGTVGSEESIYRNEKGSMVAFSLAQYVGKNSEGEKITAWHKVRAFNTEKRPMDLGVVAKGAKLVIKGHFEGRSYVNKEGKPAVETYIVADTMDVNVPVEYVPEGEYGDLTPAA